MANMLSTITRMKLLPISNENSRITFLNANWLEFQGISAISPFRLHQTHRTLQLPRQSYQTKAEETPRNGLCLSAILSSEDLTEAEAFVKAEHHSASKRNGQKNAEKLNLRYLQTLFLEFNLMNGFRSVSI